MAKKVVVTGFDPFGTATENPTLEILSHLRESDLDGIDLVTIEVPVDTTKPADVVNENLGLHKPDVWISLGLYPGLAVVHVERFAQNIKDFPMADNAGLQPYDEPIFADGPTAYPATLPIKAIVAELTEQGIPSKISNTAAAYLCNQVMYTLLHYISQKGLPTKGGFIHVPFTPQYVAGRSYPEDALPSMSMDLMVQAVKTAIKVSVLRDKDIKAPPKGF